MSLGLIIALASAITWPSSYCRATAFRQSRNLMLLSTDGHVEMEDSTVDLPKPEELTDTPTYTQPQHLITFSYTGTRKLLLPSSGRQDESLRFYKEPTLGADLRRGYNDCVWRDESIVEGLDSLLEWHASFSALSSLELSKCLSA